MTPAQRKRKAAKALDLYEKAYNEAMELLRDERYDHPQDYMDKLLEAHGVFMELRRRTDYEALIVAEVEAMHEDDQRG